MPQDGGSRSPCGQTIRPELVGCFGYGRGVNDRDGEPEGFWSSLVAEPPGGDVADWSGPLAVFGFRRPEWHRDAACRGMSPAVFFVERGGDTEPAKAVCRVRPVAGPCAAEGVGEAYGIRGGLAPKARRGGGSRAA